MFSVARRPLALVLLAAVAAGCGAPPSARTRATYTEEEHPVQLTEATTAELERAVAANKGKVVLLDSWFLGCGPCKKKFPHIVELAEKYGPDGLVVMSVDVLEDELTAKPDVLGFLREQHAAFPNYILSDPDTFREKYDAPSNPAVILFDRTGKRVDIPTNAHDDVLELAIRQAL